MLPPLVIERALQLGLDIIAITDHNASENVPAFQRAAWGTGITIIPGMEVQTREEVHVICLFDTLEQMTVWQCAVNEALPGLKNRPEYFGEQLRVNAEGEILKRDERLLITSVSLGLQDVVQQVRALEGLAIPAHIDRRAFGLLGSLGMVPEGLPLEALEISRHLTCEAATERYPSLHNFPLLRSGDAHRLSEMTTLTSFYMAAPSVAEMRLALQGIDGRKIVVR